MARIRTIKPDFWTSEQIMECSTNARLMFIGMWNFADDTGRLPSSAKSMKAKIFPGDDFSIENILGMIRELSDNDLVLPYVVDGEEFLQITGWQHQRIDKPQPSKYPAPVPENSKNAPITLPPEGKGREGKGEDITSASRTAGNEDFEALKKIYPRRKGNYGWKAAEKKFLSLVKTGVDPKIILESARHLSATSASRIGTEFIPMPASWLNSEDFLECAVAAFDDACPPEIYENVL